MALIVEDGTGLATAESYISVADAEIYLDKIGDATFAALATVASKEAALRKAAQYLDEMFGLAWAGNRVLSTQAIDWPRQDATDDTGTAIDEDVVPQAVKDATSWLALQSITIDLSPAVATPGRLTKLRVKAEVEREQEWKYGQDQQPLFPRVVRMLASAGLIQDADEAVRG